MTLRTVSSLLALLAITLGYTNPPRTLEQQEVFYQQFIEEARTTLPGSAAGTGNDDALSRFTDANMILWDYLSVLDSAGKIKAIAKPDLPSHFNNQRTMVVNRRMRRLIVFIRDPSTTEFFEYDNEDPETSFVGQMRQLVSAMVALKQNGVLSYDFDISLCFEPGTSGSWNSSAPDPTVEPTEPLPTGFPNLKQQMNWTAAVRKKVPQIKEVIFMLDGVKAAGRAPVFNYADNYKWVNNLQALRLGLTLGVEESKRAYALAYRFPVPSLYSDSLPGFPANPAPSWRSSGDTQESLAQSVYIEVYSVGTGTQVGSRFPAIFAAGYNKTTGDHNGNMAAGFFNGMLRDTQYLAGYGFSTPVGPNISGSGVIPGSGTISFASPNKTLTGQNTNFKVWDLPIIFYSLGNNQFQKVGGVSTPPTSATTATLETIAANLDQTSIPFQRTEIATAWNSPYEVPQTPDIDQTVINKIYWMFSLNYDPTGKEIPGKWQAFFGNWYLKDFMDFIDGCNAQNNNPNTPVFKNGAGKALAFPKNNYVIFQYNYATSFVGGSISEAGRTIDWKLLQEGTAD